MFSGFVAANIVAFLWLITLAIKYKKRLDKQNMRLAELYFDYRLMHKLIGLTLTKTTDIKEFTRLMKEYFQLEFIDIIKPESLNILENNKINHYVLSNKAELDNKIENTEIVQDIVNIDGISHLIHIIPFHNNNIKYVLLLLSNDKLINNKKDEERFLESIKNLLSFSNYFNQQ